MINDSMQGPESDCNLLKGQAINELYLKARVFSFLRVVPSDL